MFKFIKKALSKKKESKPQIEGIDSFLLNRPNDRISLSQYYKNRIDNNGFYRLNIESRLIIYVDLSNNEDHEDYVNKNYTTFKNALVLKHRNFIKDISNIEVPTSLNINYYFPFFDKITPTIFKNINNRDLLDFIGYNKNITTGFLSFLPTGAIFVGIKENENIEDFITQYIDRLNIITPKKHILYSIDRGTDEEPNIETDNKTKILLDRIEECLLELKKSGQFFLLAPKLERVIKRLSEDETISNIVIDKDFRIILPQYQDIEIKLSHLTKAVYILFLRHPEGILLTELHKYESELFLIYKSISYQISIDKIKNSVKELIVNDKAIFVHFSRIKSAFTKQFTDFYAELYYIKGIKGSKKQIKLPQKKIIFHKKI